MRSTVVFVLALALSTGCRSSSTPGASSSTPGASSSTPGASKEPTARPAAAAPAAASSAAVVASVAESPAAVAAPGHKQFGAPIAPGATLPLGDVLAKPDEFLNRTVTVEAKVRRNCTRRGCWMELAQALDPALPGCRVTFKDYGFFVPLDSAGSTAKVQGTVQVTRVVPAEVAHMESEGARFASKEADGTAREVRLVASGVELWREAS